MVQYCIKQWHFCFIQSLGYTVIFMVDNESFLTFITVCVRCAS